MRHCFGGGPPKERDIEDHRFVRFFFHETRILIREEKDCEILLVDGGGGKSPTEMKFLMVKSSVKEDTFWSWPLSWARRDIISSSAEFRMASVLTVCGGGVRMGS